MKFNQQSLASFCRLFMSRPLYALVILILLTSCGEDEQKLKNQNSIKLNGNSFTIISASITGVSLDGEGHAAVSLTSTNGSQAETLTIDFEYSTDQPLEGAYAFPASGEKRLLNDWLTTYSILNDSSVDAEHLAEGEVTLVHNSGDNYTLTVDLTMDGGSVFTGTYTGDFVVFFNNG